ncbi:MaoC dehydratase-like protein [Motilibacter peucedani]|uniref:MaoC dehydratase-like protein n=1 Tax=Motilibacter peucedani TaxID=598650 RepID=A0A420XLK5_9ACTN|nr:MaoC family dehydratase N-terminal domain-containing protein [Motilibacter peucedani]RKS69237.1 MaoC dehydratase-like protein [Motilibacter peucedani]
MPLDASLAGRTYPATAPYEVAVEKLREFALAVGEPASEPSALVEAVPTFPFVVAWRGLEPFLADPDLDISLERVVHGAQRFAMSRALVPGDRVRATATIESVRVLGGSAVVSARVDLAADSPGGGAPEPVGSAWSTLVIAPRGDAQ